MDGLLKHSVIVFTDYIDYIACFITVSNVEA